MSKSVPRPETLAQRTAEVLREQIKDGRYGDTLPGEPRLASQLMVARGTLRKALDSLASDGLISAGAAGVPRRVLSSFRNPNEQDARSVGVLMPRALDALALATQHFLRDLAVIVAPNGITLVHHHTAAAFSSRPGRGLKALLAEHPANLWLLYEASEPVVRFFRTAGIPAIVCGGPAVNEGLSYCGYDGIPVMRHAIGTFLRAGHTRIVAATRYHRPLRETIFREEFEKRGIPFDAEFNMPCWGGDPDRLHELLHKRLTAPDRPTAWMISGLEGLVVFYSTLMELGLRIPRDISLITIGSDPMLASFRPAISHYSTPHRTLALAMARMIRSHLRSAPAAPVLTLLQTEFVHGGSVSMAR